MEEGDISSPGALSQIPSLSTPCPVSPAPVASPATSILIAVKSVFLNAEFQPSEHISHVLAEFQTEQVQT